MHRDGSDVGVFTRTLDDVTARVLRHRPDKPVLEADMLAAVLAMLAERPD